MSRFDSFTYCDCLDFQEVLEFVAAILADGDRAQSWTSYYKKAIALRENQLRKSNVKEEDEMQQRRKKVRPEVQCGGVIKRLEIMAIPIMFIILKTPAITV